MGTEISEKKTFSVMLSEKLESVAEALPKDLNQVRFIQNALTVVNEKPELVRDFGVAQVLAGLTNGAILGLDFSKKECYLVAYGKSLNYQTSYIGAKKLLKKYAIRPVKDAYAELVHEDDLLNINIVDNKRSVTFKPVIFNKKPIVGAFAVVEFEDGDISTEVMTIEELETTRKKSKMGNAGAWRDFTTEMYKKVILRRIMKKVDCDFESAYQREIFEADTDIITDVKEQKNKDVAESANSEDFDMNVFDSVATEV